VELGQSLSAEEHVSTTVEPRRRGAGTARPDERSFVLQGAASPTSKRAAGRCPPPATART